ncbi:MAG: zinc-dependent metalloprotease [Nocardioides sp.]|nr:zinc-dependent metalloprotease [Nocardioides sp.]
MSEPRTSSMVDWDFAVSVGTRLAGDGPVVSRTEASDAVTELRDGARRSTDLVRNFTGLDAPDDTAPVLVVDRPGWIRANVDGFARVVSPLMSKLEEKKGAPSPLTQAVGSRVTAAEVGGLLGFLGGKVLGQFDPFHEPHGRLLLVAPNIVHVERELEVDSADFRLWVCLHEETHRVQFTAVPWLRDHLHSEIEALVGGFGSDTSALLSDGLKRVGDLLRGADDVSLIDLFSTPAQREVVDRVTGVMSLLEGHADVVMDGAGPEVIASLPDIRAKFNRRRKGVGVLDKVLRRLLGLDQKMAQYRDGAGFVNAVVDQVGMDGFNAVWSEPAHLPSKEEIGDPAAWVRRVHG